MVSRNPRRWLPPLAGAVIVATLVALFLTSRPVGIVSRPVAVTITGTVSEGAAVKIRYAGGTITLVKDNDGNPLEWYPDPNRPQDVIWVMMAKGITDSTTIYLQLEGEPQGCYACFTGVVNFTFFDNFDDTPDSPWTQVK